MGLPTDVEIEKLMGVLDERYQIVYNHKYRCDRKGIFRGYVYAWRNMMTAFQRIYWVYLPNYGEDIDATPLQFFHDIHHLCELAEIHYENDEEDKHRQDMIRFEQYLTQIHKFLLIRKFNRFGTVIRGEFFYFQYDPENKVYAVADECLENYAKMLSITPEIAREWLDEFKDTDMMFFGNDKRDYRSIYTRLLKLWGDKNE